MAQLPGGACDPVAVQQAEQGKDASPLEKEAPGAELPPEHPCFSSSDGWVDAFPPEQLERIGTENDGSLAAPLRVALNPCQSVNLKVWRPEDQGFWLKEGSAIAMRNLCVSIVQLLLGFAVWLVWSVLATEIQAAHDTDLTAYPFTSLGLKVKEGETASNADYKAAVMMLPAIAGLCGGTMRVTNSFMPTVCGGRNVNFLNTLLMIIPMCMAGVELQKKEADFMTLCIAAALSGIGGGAFASSMNNISFFFPKTQQGTGLGLNAGLGNFGVSISQLVAPLLMGYAAFGGGDAHGGMRVYNGVWWYVPFLAIAGVLAALYMNNMPAHEGSHLKGILTYLWMEVASWGCCAVAVVVFFATRTAKAFEGSNSIARAFIMIILAGGIQHLVLFFASPKKVRAKVRDDEIVAKVWKDKHTYIMTWLYVMCFGSFIGFSAAFPKLIKDLFGYKGDGLEKNPDAPDPKNYAWIGAFIGSLIRPVGGWMADKWTGAAVTQWCTAVQIVLAVATGILVQKAGEDKGKALDYFPGFMVLFLGLFTTTGLMNGSTFQQIAVLYAKTPVPRGMVLGWSSAVASYGAFLIPAMFGAAIKVGKAENVLYGLAAYYVTCLVVNWYYYYRSGGEAPGCVRAEEAKDVVADAEEGRSNNEPAD